MEQQSILSLHPSLIWGFAITVIIMLLLDLGIFNKKSHEVTTKEAGIWSLVWISLSMLFSGVVYWVFLEQNEALALEKLYQYQTAYWVEKALSVDNLFVFILVFGYFKVPKFLHHKVLFWGIIGALLFRAIFIFAGVGIINLTYLPAMEIFGKSVEINIVMLLFGIFLVYAGITSWGDTSESNDEDYSNNAGAKIIKSFYKIADQFDGDRFFTIQNGVKMATPLLVVIGVIEFTDVLFAVDSIPAIFAISKDPFILYTSNIFAILGLRSLYFLLANFIHKFSKLSYGLAIILAFIGLKMIIAPWYHISSPLSLSIVGGILVIAVVFSFVSSKK